MKILLFTLEYPPFHGGVAKYNQNIIESWPSPSEIFLLDNSNKKLVSSLVWPRWLPGLRRLQNILLSRKFDHVLVGEILPLGTTAWLLGLLYSFKYSVILHGTDIQFAVHKKRKKWLAKKILSNAENIICNSNFTANLTKELMGEGTVGKIHVVYPGVRANLQNSQEIKTALQKKFNFENKLVLFSLGRLVKRKGFDTMIEAMPKITEQFPNLLYAIAGIGPDEAYLKKLAQDLGKDTREKIKFIGKISEEEKWAWLRTCDVFVSPGREVKGNREGFGIVFLEAALCGKPSIAGRSGGAGEAVRDYETGILVDPESRDDLIDGVLELLTKPMLRIELGEAGMQRALKEFTPQKQASEIYKIIIS